MDRRALSRIVTNTRQKRTAPDDDDDSMAFPQHNPLKKKKKKIVCSGVFKIWHDSSFFVCTNFAH